MESWEPSQHLLIDTGKPRKTCAEVAGRRTFRILTSSQQSGKVKQAVIILLYNRNEQNSILLSLMVRKRIFYKSTRTIVYSTCLRLNTIAVLIRQFLQLGRCVCGINAHCRRTISVPKPMWYDRTTL